MNIGAMRRSRLWTLGAMASASLAAMPAMVHGQGVQPAPSPVDDNGVLTVPGFSLPVSDYMSPEAQRRFVLEVRRPGVGSSGDLAQQRRFYEDNWAGPRINTALTLYPVDIKEALMGGVSTVIVTPKNGVSARNRARVLINLHAGAFRYGSARTVGVLEAAPVANRGRFKVVSIDYRQGPENRFPAASEDVAAVYRQLLKTYKPANIGIYGCSSGGQLAAMSVAWFQKVKLPRPGAIGMSCAGADEEFRGDARYTSPATVGRAVPRAPQSGVTPPGPSAGYLAGVDRSDPLVSPVNSMAVLAKFPPTVIITGTRDFAASSAIYTHTRLIKAGVDADLHVWDGMWHDFVSDADLPEAREALDVLLKFFDRRLAAGR